MSLRVWWLAFIGGLAVLVLIAIGIARMYAPARPVPSDAPVASSPTTAKETAHITATLFFGAADGQSLAPMRRDVALAETVVDQGRQILAAQLSEVPQAPYVSVIPAGTMLRAFYVTERGDAFVDLSSDIVRGHPGGSLNELLTVYAIVNAVSANLPAVRRVQILVDGKEADTIAGHVDLRRPLTRNDSLVRETDEK
jgi:sporulation and spore germination protein